MQVTYEDKSNTLPTSNPRRIYSHEDANQVRDAINRNDHWRGAWAGTTAFPATGGTLNEDGDVAAGNEWYLSNQLVVGGNVYPAGTVIKALVDTPGQTLTNWAKLASQL